MSRDDELVEGNDDFEVYTRKRPREETPADAREREGDDAREVGHGQDAEPGEEAPAPSFGSAAAEDDDAEILPGRAASRPDEGDETLARPSTPTGSAADSPWGFPTTLDDGAPAQPSRGTTDEPWPARSAASAHEADDHDDAVAGLPDPPDEPMRMAPPSKPPTPLPPQAPPRAPPVPSATSPSPSPSQSQSRSQPPSPFLSPSPRAASPAHSTALPPYDSRGTTMRIAFAVSEFNYDITQSMLERGTAHAEFLGAEVGHIVRVPGVYDLPFAVKRLLARDDVDGVVTLGVVIEGETDHDDLVIQHAARKIVDLSLEADKPAGLGITGPGMSRMQAMARVDRAKEAVEAVVKLGRAVSAL